MQNTERDWLSLYSTSILITQGHVSVPNEMREKKKEKIKTRWDRRETEGGDNFRTAMETM
jgi:hypothetical protein